MRHASLKIDATLLLPLSYAVSRPLLTSALDFERFFLGIVPCLLLITAAAHLADRVLQGLTQADETPDALVCGLSVVFQLVGSASLWLVAELIVLQSSSNVPIVFSGETALGLLGLGGTALAFVLPRVLPGVRMGPLGALYDVIASPRRWWVRVHNWRGALLSIVYPGRLHTDMTSPARAQAYDPGVGAGDVGASSPAAGSWHHGDVVGAAHTPPEYGARAGGASCSVERSGGGGYGGGRSGERVQRRELFGVRRSIKAAFFRAAGSWGDDDYLAPGGGADDDDDDALMPRACSLPRGGSSGGLERRRMMRGASIVANTEAMTQLALAAKNNELERMAAARQELVRGVGEVLDVLSKATEAHHAAHANGEAADGSFKNGALNGALNGASSELSASHRALLNAALHAQAWLQTLLLTHDPAMPATDQGGAAARPGSERRNGRAAANASPTLAAVPHRQRDMPALAPNASGIPSGLAQAGGGAAARVRGSAPGGCESAGVGGGSPASMELTWTSALGAQDVDQRLTYGGM